MARKILGVNVQFFPRGEAVYETLVWPHLFFVSQLARDGGDFRQQTMALDENHLYEITDRVGVLWLMLSAQEQVFLIGPYLTDPPERTAQLRVLDAIGMDPGALDDLRDYHATIPLVNRSQVLLAAHAILDCLNVPANRPPLSPIDLRDSDSRPDETGLERLYPTSVFIEHTHDLQSQFMEAVSLGNMGEAVALFREVLVRTGPEDGRMTLYRKQISNTIGRTLARVAARRAGVPSRELHALTQEHSLRTAAARSVDQADRLMFELIERICTLVTRHRLSAKSPLVRKAMSQVNQHLHEKLSVASIAMDIGVTPNYLSARFHEETGQRLSAYITAMRLQRAAQLLRNSNLPILNICLSVGITDSSYFARQFKKTYGMSPSRYREAPLDTAE